MGLFSRLVSTLPSGLERDLEQTAYQPADISTSLRDSYGGSSCQKFCLWGRHGKAYHPPSQDSTSMVSFL